MVKRGNDLPFAKVAYVSASVENMFALVAPSIIKSDTIYSNFILLIVRQCTHKWTHIDVSTICLIMSDIL
jgi:hypothetical protein